jgi:hypothetical protein
MYRENCRRHLVVRARQRSSTVCRTTYMPQNGALLSGISNEDARAGVRIDEVIVQDRGPTHVAKIVVNIAKISLHYEQ